MTNKSVLKTLGGNTMGIYDGKVVLVTGSARGNGEGIAQVMAEKGATVILTDIIDQVFETAKAIGNGAEAYKMDVTKRDQVRSTVEQVIAKHGRIDVLVNNAGIANLQPFLEYTDENRDRHFNVMLNGVWICTQEILPYMLKNGYGRIVNISSDTGPEVTDHGQAAYAMAKAGVVGFTKTIAYEFAHEGITCNAILPGYILTPMVMQSAEQSRPGHPMDCINEMAQEIPMKRLGTPRDIGYLAAFLGSDEADYITGETVVIDGGNRLPETNQIGTDKPKIAKG